MRRPEGIETVRKFQRLEKICTNKSPVDAAPVLVKIGYRAPSEWVPASLCLLDGLHPKIDPSLSYGQVTIEIEIIVTDVAADDLIRKGLDEGFRSSREKACMGNIVSES